jgi:signal transduction histidine kinase
VYSNPVTYRKILRVLVIGFSAVIVLLMAAGVIGLKSAQLIRENSAEIVHNSLVTTQLIDELQREQDTLNAAFNKLSRGPELSERERLLSQLDDADQAVERIVSEAQRAPRAPRNGSATGPRGVPFCASCPEAAGTPQAELWRQLSAAVQSFSSEARRLLVRKNVPTYTSRDLLRHHEEVTAIVARMIANNSSRTLAGQTRIDQRSAQLVKESLGLLGGCLLLALLSAIFTVRITTQLFRRMEQQSSDLARVTWHMLESQETAARRFSHELHDELGQSLTAIKANVTALDPATPPDPSRLDDCRHLIDEAIQNVRELSHLLRPTILDDFGLDAGIRWLAERFGQRTGIDVEYKSAFDRRLPDETETHLFRIVQEALTNIARHSGATHVIIELAPVGNRLHLIVKDNGHGFTANGSTNGSAGLGLVGMRARAQNVGGELAINSNNGVTVDLWAPLEGAKS